MTKSFHELFGSFGGFPTRPVSWIDFSIFSVQKSSITDKLDIKNF
jgi:hypothetical protein